MPCFSQCQENIVPRGDQFPEGMVLQMMLSVISPYIGSVNHAVDPDQVAELNVFDLLQNFFAEIRGETRYAAGVRILKQFIDVRIRVVDVFRLRSGHVVQLTKTLLIVMGQEDHPEKGGG